MTLKKIAWTITAPVWAPAYAAVLYIQLNNE